MFLMIQKTHCIRSDLGFPINEDKNSVTKSGFSIIHNVKLPPDSGWQTLLPELSLLIGQ